MPVRPQKQALGALGLGAALLLALPACDRAPAVARLVPAREVRPAPPGSPSEAARREACRCWTRAERRVSQELDQLEGWDLRADVATHREEWRQRLMASDRSGDLQRALAAGVRAEALARTADETAEAAELLVRIECDLGEHAAELRQARLLVRLRPRNAKAYAILRHAALCNHQTALARQADAAWSALVRLPPPDPADAGPGESATSFSRHAFLVPPSTFPPR